MRLKNLRALKNSIRLEFRVRGEGWRNQPRTKRTGSFNYPFFSSHDERKWFSSDGRDTIHLFYFPGWLFPRASYLHLRCVCSLQWSMITGERGRKGERWKKNANEETKEKGELICSFAWRCICDNIHSGWQIDPPLFSLENKSLRSDIQRGNVSIIDFEFEYIAPRESLNKINFYCCYFRKDRQIRV